MKTRNTKLHLIIYMYAIAALLLASCENEIPYNPENREPLIVMNALLDAGESENYVYLHLSEGNSIGRVNQATLSVYVNGKLAEEVQPMTPQEIYKDLNEEQYGKDIYEEIMKNIKFKKFCLRTHFQPGDRIRLEGTAEGGKYKASSEVAVPKPLQNIQVDTCVALIRQWGSMRAHRQYRITLQDFPNEKNYYRLEIVNNKDFYCISCHYVDGEDGNYVYTNEDTTYNYRYNELINREDVILTDGHTANSDDDEDNDMFPVISNKYNIFTDSYFANSSATLKVYTPLYDDNYDILNQFSFSYCCLKHTITVSLLNFSETYYRYLQALNCLDDDDYDTTLMEPVSLPCNVEGGLGFVGVSSKVQYRITLPQKEWGWYQPNSSQ